MSQNREWLKRFSVCLNDYAEGFQEAIGRLNEMDEVLKILGKMSRANPVLVGEPGVGKTQIVEGLVKRIENGEVEGKFSNLKIYQVNVKQLVLAVKNLGNGVLDELESLCLNSDVPLAFFIDEMHLVMQGKSARGSVGDSEFINVLKPYLNRGCIKIIGATTLAEYKDLEEDKALERRVTPIFVKEPTFNETVEILKGVAPRLEQHHHVQFEPSVLPLAVTLASRYMKEKCQPAVSVDLLDRFGASVSFNRQSSISHDEWVRYVDGVSYHQNVQIPLAEGLVLNDNDLQEFVKQTLNIQTVELNRLAEVKRRLEETVVGQSNAVEKVSESIVLSTVNLSGDSKPKGSFLLYGSTGVGKTELAKRTAEVLFGDANKIIRLDMNEFLQPHSVTRITGAPPSYVGYGKPSVFDVLRKDPQYVVLIDEFEKAHPDVMRVFLTVLDEGYLKDSLDNRIPFSETFIFFTTNAVPDGEQGVGKIGFIGDTPSNNRPSFSSFPPELVNRFDEVIKMNDMTHELYLGILNLRLAELESELGQYSLFIADYLKDEIVKATFDKKMGARPLSRFKQTLKKRLARQIVENPSVYNFTLELQDGQFEVLPSESPLFGGDVESAKPF